MPTTLRVGQIPGEIRSVEFPDTAVITVWDAIHAAFGDIQPGQGQIAAVKNGEDCGTLNSAADGDLVLFRLLPQPRERTFVELRVQIQGREDLIVHVSDETTLRAALNDTGVLFGPNSMFLDEDDDELSPDERVGQSRTVRIAPSYAVVARGDERDASRREFVVRTNGFMSVDDLLADLAGFEFDLDYQGEPILDGRKPLLEAVAGYPVR